MHGNGGCQTWSWAGGMNKATVVQAGSNQMLPSIQFLQVKAGFFAGDVAGKRGA